MVNLSAITKSFDSLQVLSGMSIKFLPGEFTCILGPTGCGKTTLLRIIAGLLEPDSGVVQTPSQSMSMIFQQQTLFPWRSVLSNVCFPLELSGYPKRERVEMAKARLSEVGLSNVMKKRVYELSGGMQQRVQLARALVSNPSVLLADEPFVSLDEKTRYTLQNQLREIADRNNMTVVFVTHNIEEAVYLADRVVVMGNKRIQSEFVLSATHPRDRLSQWFLDNMLEVRKVFEDIVTLDLSADETCDTDEINDVQVVDEDDKLNQEGTTQVIK
ncbi:MAG TPA: ABC transporter ATP-binding protein [Caldisericia bacterium]|nr:ABC transporter ATP-binding protein [Caldisericia bacterium]HPF48506.1 ABC transporter ATP-binding protein [Caldisericia bacterium]HPI83313.1 ABC transporter ATP-binding protein [Caldisericia bacterium]HPQ92961.1 ABC transporter ATP-binding protein [Caldisericia bacterium]HRV75205.1 ABC transporter ATP-binding protein [Caldisericia bacterium]